MSSDFIVLFVFPVPRTIWDTAGATFRFGQSSGERTNEHTAFVNAPLFEQPAVNAV